MYHMAHFIRSVDSSSVVGIMSNKIKDNVKTYSIGFKDKKYDETEFAKSS